METTISRLHFIHLRNSEYSIFVNQVVKIIKKYNPELLHLQKAFDRLVSKLSDLDKIKAQASGNPLSKSLCELDASRAILINAITGQIRVFRKLTMPAIAPHVIVIKHFLHQHGQNIATANYNAATERTRDLLADYDAKADVKTSAAALNLAIIFEELRNVNTQFANLFLQRTKEEAAVEKVDSHAIRREINKVLTNVLDAFEFCSSEYGDQDYATPASELNELIAYYKTQLKGRTTRSRKSKNEAL